MKVVNSWLVNPVPLSKIKCSGTPWVENTNLSTLMVASEDVDGTMCASIHLE